MQMGRVFAHSSVSTARRASCFQHPEAGVYFGLGPLVSFRCLRSIRVAGGLGWGPRPLKTCPWGPALQAEAAGCPSPGGCVCGCPEEAAGPDAAGPGRAAGALGHLLCTGREEFFARPLKELFFRLRDQVPANLGDENRGLEGGKGKDSVSAGEGPGHRGPPSAAGHALVPGVRRARLPLRRRLALGHAQCSVVQGRGQAGRW